MASNLRNKRQKDPSYQPYQYMYDGQPKPNFSSIKFNKKIWSHKEDRLYVQFLKQNRNLFQNNGERRQSRTFKSMSRFIKKRNPDQCRSHHQKMEIKFGSVDNIIKGIQESKLNTQIQASRIINQEQIANQKIILDQVNSQNNDENGDKLGYQELQLKQYSIYQQDEQENQVIWELVDSKIWIEPLSNLLSF